MTIPANAEHQERVMVMHIVISWIIVSFFVATLLLWLFKFRS